jgi:hypothetical protein
MLSISIEMLYVLDWCSVMPFNLQTAAALCISRVDDVKEKFNQAAGDLESRLGSNWAESGLPSRYCKPLITYLGPGSEVWRFLKGILPTLLGLKLFFFILPFVHQIYISKNLSSLDLWKKNFFLAVVVFQLRALCLLGRCSTSRAMPPSPFLL